MYITLKFIHNRLEGNPALAKILANTGWLTFEKIFRMALGLIVSVMVARHLGPGDFGMLSYAISLVTFMGAFVYLGLSGIVVRDLVKHPKQKYSILGTTFAMKVTGSFLAYFAILFVSYNGGIGNKEFLAIALIGASLFFRPFETIDFWFQSQVTSKFSVFSKSVAFSIVSALNILFVLMGAPLVLFAAAHATEIAITAIFLVLLYLRNGQKISQWKINFSRAKILLGESWILLLSSFLATVYLKIDQIMLRWIVGTAEVGVYSVAVNFSEAWYFIPMAISLSLYPSLIELKEKSKEKYLEKVQKSFDVLLILAVVVGLFITAVAEPLINLLYGVEFSEASSILMIHIWAGIFIFMRALLSRLILIEDLLVFSLLTHSAGAVINVALNLLLIKLYGGYGAAVATLISYAVASYFSLFMFRRTQTFAFMMSRSFLLPVRALVWFRKN